MNKLRANSLWALIFVLPFLALALLGLQHAREARRALQAANTITKLELDQITAAVGAYHTAFQKYPATDYFGSERFGQQLLKDLTTNASNLVFIAPTRISLKYGCFTDRFGNAINFKFPTNDPRSITLKLWSNGINGKNEYGSGDDISAEMFLVSVQ